MRADMAKVIVERPRFGSRYKKAAKGYRKAQGRLALDEQSLNEQPRREGMKRRGGGTRELNEHLGPLRRFLRSRVGLPWDQVFAEICARIDRSSAVQDHVRDHVDGYVARRVKLVDGVPCYTDGWLDGQPLSSGWNLFYVCPRSRRLLAIRRHTRRRPPRLVPFLSACILHGYLEYFLCVRGVWLLAEMATFPPARVGSVDVLGVPGAPGAPIKKYDVALKQEISKDQAVRHYGAAVYATAVRLATREEIRRYCK